MYFPIFLSIHLHNYQKVCNKYPNNNYPIILPPDQDHYKLFLKKYHIFLKLHHHYIKNIFE